jgi:hypothetical protein
MALEYFSLDKSQAMYRHGHSQERVRTGQHKRLPSHVALQTNFPATKVSGGQRTLRGTVAVGLVFSKTKNTAIKTRKY